MFSMQANEVKAQLSEVLRKVEQGEEIMITRHGKVVARLMPWNERKQVITDRLQAVEAIQTFQRIKLPQGETIADLISEGRH
jgi:prevent-host-death family protein